MMPHLHKISNCIIKKQLITHFIERKIEWLVQYLNNNNNKKNLLGLPTLQHFIYIKYISNKDEDISPQKFINAKYSSSYKYRTIYFYFFVFSKLCFTEKTKHKILSQKVSTKLKKK